MNRAQHCGNCTHWKYEQDAPRGECASPLPASLEEASRIKTRGDDGTDCAMWRGRFRSDRNRALTAAKAENAALRIQIAELRRDQSAVPALLSEDP